MSGTAWASSAGRMRLHRPHLGQAVTLEDLSGDRSWRRLRQEPPPRPRVIIPRERIASRVRALGRAIARDLAAGREGPLLLLALLDGGFCFVADLARALPLPDVEIAFLRTSSYRAGTRSTGVVEREPVPPVAGRTVLIVDDILDTGRTLAAVRADLTAAGAAAGRACVLIDKPARRVDPAGKADYVGFAIPDAFVIGYGLDHAGRWRHLPDLCVLDEG